MAIFIEQEPAAGDLLEHAQKGRSKFHGGPALGFSRASDRLESLRLTDSQVPLLARTPWPVMTQMGDASMRRPMLGGRKKEAPASGARTSSWRRSERAI